MSQERSNKKVTPITRNSSLDFIKGICIFLVIYGHYIQVLDPNFERNVIYIIIYSFHMPVFMSISGYLFYYSIKKYSFGQLLKKKLLSLGYPLLLWGMVASLVAIILREGTADRGITAFCYSSVTQYWFLESVLLNCIIVACIYKMLMLTKRKTRSRFVYKIVYILTGSVVTYIAPGWHTKLFMMFFVFMAGFLYAELKTESVRSKEKAVKYLNNVIPVVYLVLLIVEITVMIYCHVESRLQNYLLYGFEFLLSLVGAYVVVSKGVTLYQRIKDLAVTDYLINLGKKSLQLYVLQRVLVEIVINHFLGKARNNYMCISALLSLGTILILNYIVSLSSSKSKIGCFLWGR